MKFGLREIVFIVLLMGIPVAAWWFVYRPQNARNADMRQEIEIRQAKLRELNKATSAVGNLEKQIAKLDEAVEFFRSKLPEEKEIDKILQEIWLLAETNELQAKSIRTLSRGGQKSYVPAGSTQAEQPIAVQLEGDFRGFYSFLLALEDQPRIMRVRSMKLRQADKGEPGSIVADFEMSIFFERDHKG